MVEYLCGFYRGMTSFDEATLRATLEALHKLGLGFFPAGLWRSQEERLALKHPLAYERSLVPSEYYIDPGVARIPFEGANSVSFTFTESDKPSTYPASFLLEFTGETLAANRWNLDTLLALFRSVISSFNPDFGYVYDQEHADRPNYGERRFEFDSRRVPDALFWINYYGPEWAKNLGADRIERLRPSVASLEWLDNGGVLIAIQDAPYDEGNAAHREHQLELERVLGLEELQASFPNPGL
jgi:hypothetical protein